MSIEVPRETMFPKCVQNATAPIAPRVAAGERLAAVIIRVAVRDGASEARVIDVARGGRIRNSRLP
jgi:hypothetical protein